MVESVKFSPGFSQISHWLVLCSCSPTNPLSKRWFMSQWVYQISDMFVEVGHRTEPIEGLGYMTREEMWLKEVKRTSTTGKQMCSSAFLASGRGEWGVLLSGSASWKKMEKNCPFQHCCPMSTAKMIADCYCSGPALLWSAHSCHMHWFLAS